MLVTVVVSEGLKGVSSPDAEYWMVKNSPDVKENCFFVQLPCLSVIVVGLVRTDVVLECFLA
ncbi:hypothetical protein SAMN05443507_11951 [Alicyclobacillus tolerans]|uniref:Uncharacterized protein n=1 Tax=Alicyclobacillus tolerans TaxID=90970 RepID=A0A1M6UDL6_9BACL|nr:hypothetical protein SAMN05443507_11951 [Alicyclobacillus montanus]